MIHSIEEILNVEPYKLTVRFNTEEVRQIDLSEKLNEWGSNPKSKFAELKNPDTFKKVALEKEFGTIVWENGLDLCPDFLYNLSQKIKDPNVA